MEVNYFNYSLSMVLPKQILFPTWLVKKGEKDPLLFALSSHQTRPERSSNAAGTFEPFSVWCGLDISLWLFRQTKYQQGTDGEQRELLSRIFWGDSAAVLQASRQTGCIIILVMSIPCFILIVLQGAEHRPGGSAKVVTFCVTPAAARMHFLYIIGVFHV